MGYWQELKEMLWGLLDWRQWSLFRQPPQKQERQEVHLDKEVVGEIAKEVARRIGELSPKTTEATGPGETRTKRTINIKTTYMPEVPEIKTDEEEIQANLGVIKPEEEESSDIDTSLKALKEISRKKQEKS